MLFVVCCLVFAFDVRCLMSGVCYVGVRCLVFGVWCVPFVVCVMLFVVCCELYVVCYFGVKRLMFVVCGWWFSVRCLLFVVFCVLLVECCLLFVIRVCWLFAVSC